MTPEYDREMLAAIAGLRGLPDADVTAVLVKCMSSSRPGVDPLALFFAINAVVSAIREAARQDAVQGFTVMGIQ